MSGETPAPEAAPAEAPETYVMDLSKPIGALGERVTRLTLRDPGSGALEGIEVALGRGGLRFDVGALVKIIAAAANVPHASAKEIPMKDLLKHFEGILVFFGADTQATG